MSTGVPLRAHRFSSPDFNWHHLGGRNQVLGLSSLPCVSFLPLISLCLCVPALVFLSPHSCIYLLIWPSIRPSNLLLCQLVYLTVRLAALWIPNCWLAPLKSCLCLLCVQGLKICYFAHRPFCTSNLQPRSFYFCAFYWCHMWWSSILYAFGPREECFRHYIDKWSQKIIVCASLLQITAQVYYLWAEMLDYLNIPSFTPK